MTVRSFSPQAPADLVGEFPASGADDVAREIERARSAQAEWIALGAAARSAAMHAAGAALRERSEEAVALVVREVGKPTGEAAGEVARAIAILDYYAQACLAPTGEQFPPSVGGLLYAERRPHGVAGLITPWNFPLAIPLWKAAPALAAGNAVVHKPSPEASACAELLRSLFADSAPPGLYTVVQGEAETGAALVDGVDVVSFTGSSAVGHSILQAAAARGVPVQCEMGGQNAAVVLEDAPAGTAAMVAAAAMGYAGQKCTATRRIVVVGDCAQITDELAAAVAALEPSSPDSAGALVGPVISEAARAKVAEAIQRAREDGGEVLCGGRVLDRDGWYVEPTLVSGLAPSHALAQQETFGPFALLIPAADLHEATAIANGVDYGLVTSFHGQDLDRLLGAVRDSDSGLIKVNAPTSGVDFYAPFGGEKASSYGLREQGPGALDFYSSTRTVTIATP
jgi:alpha-ketoglutaric semialdehyde dehydrogenase